MSVQEFIINSKWLYYSYTQSHVDEVGFLFVYYIMVTNHWIIAQELAEFIWLDIVIILESMIAYANITFEDEVHFANLLIFILNNHFIIKIPSLYKLPRHEAEGEVKEQVFVNNRMLIKESCIACIDITKHEFGDHIFLDAFR